MAGTFVLDDETVTLVGVTEEVARKEGLPDAALLLRADDDALDAQRSERMRAVGLCRLVVDGDNGGMGLTMRSAVAIVEALGRAFVPESLVAENIAAYALGLAGTLVPDGPLTWTGNADEEATGVVVRNAPLVVGFIGDEVVAYDSARVVADVVDERDPTRRLATWRRSTTEPSVRLPADISRIVDVAAVLMAAEAVGVMALAVERTVEFAKERQQFGRPIGGFQAVKHQLADMWAATELARAVVEQAAMDLDAGVAPRPTVGAACAITADAFVDVTSRCVHLHGAMGYAWESGCHLFVRRALSTATLLGDPSHHRRRALSAFGPAERAQKETP